MGTELQCCVFVNLSYFSTHSQIQAVFLQLQDSPFDGIYIHTSMDYTQMMNRDQSPRNLRCKSQNRQPRKPFAIFHLPIKTRTNQLHHMANMFLYWSRYSKPVQYSHNIIQPFPYLARILFRIVSNRVKGRQDVTIDLGFGAAGGKDFEGDVAGGGVGEEGLGEPDVGVETVA